MLRKRTSTINGPHWRIHNKAEANGSTTSVKSLFRRLLWPSKANTACPDERRSTGACVEVSSAIQHSASPPAAEGQLHGDRSENLDPIAICVKSIRDLEVSIQDSSKFSKRLSYGRNELKFVQSQRGYEMEKARNKLKFLDESIAALTMSPSAQAESQSPQSDSDTASTISQLTDDWKDFLNSWKAIAHFDNIVNSKQSQVVRFETKLVSAVKSLLIQLPGGEESVNQSEALIDINTESTVSEPVPETARQLFERSGNLAALEEQLQSIDINYFNEQERRNLIREQDREPDMSDAEFESRYGLERRTKEAENENAHAEMASLQLQCKREGIDLSRFGARQTRISLATDDQIPLEHNLADDGHAAIVDDHDQQSETDGHKNVLAVEGWLEEIERNSETTI